MVKIGFIGCHEISYFCLKKICQLAQQNDDFVTTVINLPRDEGSKHSAYVDFESLQKEFGFNLHYIADVSSQNSLEILKKSKLDVLFIIGWHRIVPNSVLDVAKIRLGIHSSMLPKDRGASPINWQIIRGEKNGGVTLFHLTEGVDSGGVVEQYGYNITEHDNVKDVYQKATNGSIILLEKNWEDIRQLRPKNIKQDEEKVTINKRRKPEDGIIMWSKSAKEIHNWVRALTKPYPGAFTNLNKKKVFFWKTKIVKHIEGKEGEIMDNEKLIVSTKNGCLEVLEVQLENEPMSSGEVFMKANNISKGMMFD